MTQKSLPRIITKYWSGANIYTHARGFHLGRKITTWRARPIVQRAMGRLSLAPGSPSINFAAIEFGGENRGMYSRGRWLRKQEENFSGCAWECARFSPLFFIVCVNANIARCHIMR